MIRVTFTAVLSEIWGADECYDEGGEQAIIDLVNEDIVAFLEEGDWTVEQVRRNP